jgi:hypothetical protein
MVRIEEIFLMAEITEEEGGTALPLWGDDLLT